MPSMPLRALLDLAGHLLQGLPARLWVEANVIACKAAKSGHSLELAEAGAAPGQSGTLRAYLPEAVMRRIALTLGGSVDPLPLVGTTTLILLAPQWDPRFHLSARILDLGRDATLSLARHRVDLLRGALRREALYDRQRGLPRPADVTRVVVIHPMGAAGYADIAAELDRWAAAGLIVQRHHEAPFEGASAPQAIAKALDDAVRPLEGGRPDVILMVRGGGARSGLEGLDHETIVRAVASCTVPVICGLGHAIDRALVDEVAWRSCDTPSKALAFLAALIRAPAIRMRQQMGAIAILARQRADAAGIGVERLVADTEALGRKRLGHADTALAVMRSDLRVSTASASARCQALTHEARRSVEGIVDLSQTCLDAALRASQEHRTAIGHAVCHRLTTADSGERALSQIMHAASARVDHMQTALTHLRESTDTGARLVLDRAAEALAATDAVIAASSVETQLARGFALVTDHAGLVLTTTAALRSAGDITLLVADGDVGATIQIP